MAFSFRRADHSRTAPAIPASLRRRCSAQSSLAQAPLRILPVGIAPREPSNGHAAGRSRTTARSYNMWSNYGARLGLAVNVVLTNPVIELHWSTTFAAIAADAPRPGVNHGNHLAMQRLYCILATLDPAAEAGKWTTRIHTTP
jgi:hypothetical protein